MASKKDAKKTGAGPFESLRGLKEHLQKAQKQGPQPDRGNSAKRDAAAPLPKPPTHAPSTATSAVDENDAAVMHRLFAGVEPLDRSRGRIPRQSIERSPMLDKLPTQIADEASREAEAVHAHLRTLVEGGSRFEVEDDGTRVEGRRLDLPFDALRRLRRGSLPIDGRLDLHGMTAPEARVKVAAFLQTMRSRGERCVLVIHGKGEHSPQGAGVLRGEIAAWLSQSAASEHVAGFTTAAASDGGEGAVYVLLRR